MITDIIKTSMCVYCKYCKKKIVFSVPCQCFVHMNGYARCFKEEIDKLSYTNATNIGE